VVNFIVFCPTIAIPRKLFSFLSGKSLVKLFIPFIGTEKPEISDEQRLYYSLE
jgi:hypothetical protein